MKKRRRHRRRPGRRTSFRKRILFSLLPVVLLVAGAELFLRVSGWAKSPITPIALPGEEEGLFRFDPDVFWALSPNLSLSIDGITVTTNQLGLRCAEIPDKKGDEYRILSLGESTTFGIGVEDDQTYSSLLEGALNRSDSKRPVRVINAAVSAYTSFQSLQYLKSRGLALQPDMILFYHEVNDFLPTYMRSSQNTIVGMGLTDQQRFESRVRQRDRSLLSVSAIYRFIRYRTAYAKLQAMQEDPAQQAQLAIELAIVDGREQPMKFPTRVSIAERRNNLKELQQICAQHGIKLVLIHPTYRFTKPHDCLLTEFSRQNKVTMVELQDVLHPAGSDAGQYFSDMVHPTVVGHERIAARIVEVIQDHIVDVH